MAIQAIRSHSRSCILGLSGKARWGFVGLVSWGAERRTR